MIITKYKIGLLTLLLLTTFLFNKTAVTKAGNVIVLPNYNGILTMVGYYVYGEIQNNESFPIKDVILNIKFNLTTGEEITYTLSTVLPVILTGRRSPFIFLLSNKTLSANVSSFSISINDYDEAEIWPTRLGIAHWPGNDSVIGVIANNGFYNLSFVSVFGTFYDKNRKILAIVQSDAMTMLLEPGGKESFRIFYPFEQGLEDIRYYSLTAYSTHPECTVENEVKFAVFKEENEGLSPILIIFISLIVFSALVLTGAYVVTKIKHRKKRIRRAKHS